MFHCRGALGSLGGQAFSSSGRGKTAATGLSSPKHAEEAAGWQDRAFVGGLQQVGSRLVRLGKTLKIALKSDAHMRSFLFETRRSKIGLLGCKVRPKLQAHFAEAQFSDLRRTGSSVTTAHARRCQRVQSSHRGCIWEARCAYEKLSSRRTADGFGVWREGSDGRAACREGLCRAAPFCSKH